MSPPVSDSATAIVRFCSRRSSATISSSPRSPAPSTRSPSRARISRSSSSSLRLAAASSSRAHQDAHQVVGELGAEAEHGVGVVLRDVVQHAVEVRLADPERAQEPRAHHATAAEPRADARHHFLVEHAVELARHAGHEEELRELAAPRRVTSSMKPGAVPSGFASTTAPSGKSACFALFSAISRLKRRKNARTCSSAAASR